MDTPPSLMEPQITPTRLNLKRDEKLEVDWQDGLRSVYKIAYLRAMCPCAACKIVRETKQTPVAHPAAARSLSLSVLPGNYSKPLAAVSAEMVGNYAIKIDWSDEHGSGIYSFQYLREISPETR